MYKSEKPTLSEKSSLNKGEVYNHPAYGLVTLTQVTGQHTLFGSDIGHSAAMRIQVKRAELHRDLGRDWIHGREIILDFELSHAQFAQFITSQGNGSGTPVTIRYAPAKGSVMEACPAIENIKSKAETHREEIKNSAKNELAKIQEQLNKLEAMLAGGSVSKKELKEIHHSMKCQVHNLPLNLEHAVSSAEKALENATVAAKIEVDAFIQMSAQRIGLEHISQLNTLQIEKK